MGRRFLTRLVSNEAVPGSKRDLGFGMECKALLTEDPIDFHVLTR